jgi:hypothetical protein
VARTLRTPVRLYLTASVVYVVIAASTPNLRTAPGSIDAGGILDDPVAFQRRLLDAMPRVFFAMLPLFRAFYAESW